jgi:hypothetical protein
MEHDAPMARLHVPPTGEERAGVGAHRSNKYSLVFASSLFPELMASVLSREPDSFDSGFERGCDRPIVFFPLFNPKRALTCQ